MSPRWHENAEGSVRKIQPRMPWHDVQCRIEGPSVFDLSMNFVQRWNSIGQLYEHAYNTRIGSRARLINKFIPLDLKARVKAPRLEKANLPKETSSEGGVAIQVIRSAPAGLLQDMATAKEHATAKAGGDAHSAQGAPAKGAKQDNCLKAMLKAIHSAQHFLYIENQFFQSDFGAPGPVRSQATGPLNQKLSGPMGALMSFHRSPAYRKFARQLGIEGLPADQILKHIKWSQVDDVLRDPAGRLFFKDLMDALKNLGMAEATQRLGPSQDHVMNPILQALVARIRKAIVEDGVPFHVYLVMPVHPEGTLHTPNVMHQVHLTMQAISHGHDSLLNGVRRASLERRKLKEQGLKPTSPAAAAIRKELRSMTLKDLAEAVGDAWKNHLTLLNLRNWAILGGRKVTEQIYVHSKTLIADDRVAILGSANINDRSQLGDRDSELAVIIRDTQQAQLALDGVHASPVSGCVSELRKNLWKKIFGLSGGEYPATALKGVLDQPAAPATWKQIQQVAKDNAGHYEKAFWYIPRSVAHPQIQPPTSEDRTPPCSIWPTWRYHNSLKHQEGGRMRYRMPFEAAFWREVKVGEEANAWQVEGGAQQAGRAPEEAPKGIQGFIVELPIGWTQFEHNDSGQNLTLLAGLQGPVGIDGLEPPRLHLAQAEAPTEETPA